MHIKNGAIIKAIAMSLASPYIPYGKEVRVKILNQCESFYFVHVRPPYDYLWLTSGDDGWLKFVLEEPEKGDTSCL